MLVVADKNSTLQAWYLLATSWTSDPLGTWCVFALDATVDGSTPTAHWADFPGLAVDDQAVYITSNQFSFPTSSGTFQYSKLRILNKAQLYNNTCALPAYTDFWGFTESDSTKSFTQSCPI